MGKAIALLITVVLAGHIVTVTLLLGGRGSGGASGGARFESGDPDGARLLEAIAALRKDVDSLSNEVARRPAPVAAAGGAPDPAPADESALAARLDQVIERLDALEKSLATIRDVNEELAVARLREKREEQFRSEDGYTVADELLEEKKYALGANGILTFLDAHPDDPDARDLMRKARDAFLRAGYGEKALWLQGEIMSRYPEHRGADLYGLAMMEKQLRKFDDAMRHIEESIELASRDQDRMNRMFYRAYLIHQRDGDEAGLAAYREVERVATTAGIRTPAEEAGKRAKQIEERLAGQ